MNIKVDGYWEKKLQREKLKKEVERKAKYACKIVLKKEDGSPICFIPKDGSFGVCLSIPYEVHFVLDKMPHQNFSYAGSKSLCRISTPRINNFGKIEHGGFKWVRQPEISDASLALSHVYQDLNLTRLAYWKTCDESFKNFLTSIPGVRIKYDSGFLEELYLPAQGFLEFQPKSGNTVLDWVTDQWSEFVYVDLDHLIEWLEVPSFCEVDFDEYKI